MPKIEKSRRSDDFFSWLIGRQNEACRGHRGKTPELLAIYNKTLGKASCEAAVRQAVASDPSDPFTESRVRSYFVNGVAEASDYSCGFMREVRTIDSQVSGRAEEHIVQVPINIKKL